MRGKNETQALSMTSRVMISNEAERAQIERLGDGIAVVECGQDDGGNPG